MQIKESGEDYLEMILMLQNKGGPVRSIDIAEKMNLSRASVSVAMKNLRNAGYITMDANHEITLTSKGRELAEVVYERHLLFLELLTNLGVDHQVALNDACHMEHALSAESFQALKKYFSEKEPIPSNK